METAHNIVYKRIRNFSIRHDTRQQYQPTLTYAECIFSRGPHSWDFKTVHTDLYKTLACHHWTDANSMQF
jgi:hypothetical protein